MADSALSIDTGRFARLVTLIAGVTTVSLLTSANVLSSDAMSIAVVAIGGIALVTTMIGFLIAMGSSYDESVRGQRRRAESERGNR